MPFDSLRAYLDVLEELGELRRITAEVDPVHELGAIAYCSLLEQGPSLLFENVKGYGTPLVTNVLGTDGRVALAFGVENRMHAMFEAILAGMDQPVPPREVATGPCKEVIQRGAEADVTLFPTPVWHERDAGPYFGTFHGCVTADRDSGDLNLGMYRLMVRDRQTLSTSMHGDGLRHYRKWEQAGEPMPMAVVVGMEPLLCVASGSAISAGGARHAEYAVVGGWRHRPVELVRCETSDLLVPAEAEIVVEGTVTPSVRLSDGPHGESHGFYGVDPQGLEFRVTCVTHRANPIHQGLICGQIQDGGKRITRSAVLWGQLKRMGLPGLVDLRFPDPGCGLEICVVAADVAVPGQAHRIIDAVWAASAIAPAWTIVVDPDAQPDDWNDIWWRLYTMVLPHRDVWISPNRLTGAHQPLAQHGFVSRIGIDATSRFKDVAFPERNAVSPELMARVRARWAELGLA
jgi:4-hydroxy-3-polyprenylbenzoate decarboxylase